MTILQKISIELLESRVKFIEEMYQQFIQEESSLRNTPMDFKNFITWKIEKEIEHIKK